MRNNHVAVNLLAFSENAMWSISLDLFFDVLTPAIRAELVATLQAIGFHLWISIVKLTNAAAAESLIELSCGIIDIRVLCFYILVKGNAN
jgi:hypothetical protein